MIKKNKILADYLDAIPELAPIFKPPKKNIRLKPSQAAIVETIGMSEHSRCIRLLDALKRELLPSYLSEPARQHINEQVEKVKETLWMYLAKYSDIKLDDEIYPEAEDATTLEEEG